MMITRIDKGDGQMESVPESEVRQTIQRIAGHLGLSEQNVLDILETYGEIHTSFSIYMVPK